MKVPIQLFLNVWARPIGVDVHPYTDTHGVNSKNSILGALSTIKLNTLKASIKVNALGSVRYIVRYLVYF